MNWKYYIPHAWPNERERWEDALLRPDDPDYRGESLTVTIDCLGDPPGDSASADSREWYEHVRGWLADRPFRLARKGEMGGTDMVVGTRDFTRDEFLEWVKVWLRELGFPVAELVSTLLSEFNGTHPHADLLQHLINAFPSQGAVDPS